MRLEIENAKIILNRQKSGRCELETVRDGNGFAASPEGASIRLELEEKGISMDPNTLYPLLRRLEKQGLLASAWETGGSKPRKYYQITPYGQEIYQKLKAQWEEMVAAMERLLQEEDV